MLPTDLAPAYNNCDRETQILRPDIPGLVGSRCTHRGSEEHTVITLGILPNG